MTAPVRPAWERPGGYRGPASSAQATGTRPVVAVREERGAETFDQIEDCDGGGRAAAGPDVARVGRHGPDRKSV
ncbi:hypothetical protein, partial [Streptomyces prunicolor]